MRHGLRRLETLQPNRRRTRCKPGAKQTAESAAGPISSHATRKRLSGAHGGGSSVRACMLSASRLTPASPCLTRPLIGHAARRHKPAGSVRLQPRGRRLRPGGFHPGPWRLRLFFYSARLRYTSCVTSARSSCRCRQRRPSCRKQRTLESHPSCWSPEPSALSATPARTTRPPLPQATNDLSVFLLAGTGSFTSALLLAPFGWTSLQYVSQAVCALVGFEF